MARVLFRYSEWFLLLPFRGSWAVGENLGLYDFLGGVGQEQDSCVGGDRQGEYRCPGSLLPDSFSFGSMAKRE